MTGGGEGGGGRGMGEGEKTRVKPDAIHSTVKVEVFNFTSSRLS